MEIKGKSLEYKYIGQTLAEESQAMAESAVLIKEMPCTRRQMPVMSAFSAAKCSWRRQNLTA